MSNSATSAEIEFITTYAVVKELSTVCTGHEMKYLVQTRGGRKFSGADRDRTDDIQLAKLALSQLSYSPGKRSGPGKI